MELYIGQAAKKNSPRQLAAEDSRNIKECFKVSCKNKSNWNWMHEQSPYEFSDGRGWKRQGAHRVPRIYRRVSSASSGEVSDHLQ